MRPWTRLDLGPVAQLQRHRPLRPALVPPQELDYGVRTEERVADYGTREVVTQADHVVAADPHHVP